MSVDPRLAIIARADPNRARLERESEHGRRLGIVEQARPTVQSVAGTPTTAPRDGTLAADPVNRQLWVRVAGAWLYAPLLSAPPPTPPARGQVTLTIPTTSTTISNLVTVTHNLGVPPAAILMTVYGADSLNGTLTPVAKLATNTTFQCWCISGAYGPLTVTFSWAAFA